MGLSAGRISCRRSLLAPTIRVPWLRLRAGDPLSFACRAAKRVPQRPLNDPHALARAGVAGPDYQHTPMTPNGRAYGPQPN